MVVGTGLYVQVPGTIAEFAGSRFVKSGIVRVLVPMIVAKPELPLGLATSLGPGPTSSANLELYAIAADQEFEETSTPLAAIATAKIRYHAGKADVARDREAAYATLWNDDVFVMRTGERVSVLSYPRRAIPAGVAEPLVLAQHDAKVVFAGGGGVMLELDAAVEDVLGGAVVMHRETGPVLAGMIVDVRDKQASAANFGQLRTAAWR